jgi:glycosyltransferase 2 family protein
LKTATKWGWLALLVLMAFMASRVIQVDWPAFKLAISQLPSRLWLVVVLSLLSYLARFIRWHVFLKALGHSLAFWASLEIYIAGFAFTLSPGKAGETIRSVYLHRLGVGYPQSIGAFIAERLLDIAILGSLACMTLFMFSQPVLYITLLVLLSLIGVFIFLKRNPTLFSWAKRWLGLKISTSFSTVNHLLSFKQVIKVLPYGFLAWFLQGLSLYLITRALGYDLGVAKTVAIYALSILLGAASLIPGGIGATEASLAFWLHFVGMPQSAALAAALVTRGLTMWLAIGMGLLFMGKITVSHRKNG